eukprot:8699513-Prorocentrum_lima.AAC.1
MGCPNQAEIRSDSSTPGTHWYTPKRGTTGASGTHNLTMELFGMKPLPSYANIREFAILSRIIP